MLDKNYSLRLMKTETLPVTILSLFSLVIQRSEQSVSNTLSEITCLVGITADKQITMSNFEKVTSLFLILIGLSEFLTHTLTPSFIVLNKKKVPKSVLRGQV